LITNANISFYILTSKDLNDKLGGIFKLDYDKMKENFKLLGNDIVEKALNPDRIKRLSIIYNFNFEDWFI
jgi:hypothetical protein